MMKDKKMGEAKLKDREVESKSAILEGIDLSYLTEADNEMEELITKWLKHGYSMEYINGRLDEIAKNPPESMKMISNLAEKIKEKIELS